MATKYDQPSVMEKRIRFFDGQFLTDQDFIDEQLYHLDRNRRHQRLLHVSGIADGLGVRTTGPRAVTVDAGTAVDTLGRTMALRDAVAVALPGDRFDGATGVLVCLAYQEQPADQQKGQGTDDDTRWLERPAVVVLLPDDPWTGTAPPVLLAQLALDSHGTVQVDSTVRQYAGVRLPGPAADPAALRALASGSVGLHGTLTVDGHLGVGTEPDVAEGWDRVVDVLGDRDTKLAVRTGAVDSRVIAHTDGYWGSAPGMVVGTRTAHALALATGGTTRASLSPSGKLGIGTDPTQEPMHELSVIGKLHLERGVIQCGAPAVTDTNDLGLYSQYRGAWVRLVTNQAPIRFFTDGGPGRTTRFTVETDGKTGIGGVTAPLGWLDVTGTGDNYVAPSLLLRSGNSSDRYWGVQIGFAYNGTTQYRHHIRSRHNPQGRSGNALDFFVWTPDAGGPDGWPSQQVMSLDGGNVGIGTTPANPDNLDRVVDVLGATNAGLTVRSPTVDARVVAHDRGIFGAPSGMVVGTKSGHPLSLATSGATKVTLGVNGRVGIGTADPQAWLDVPGAGSGPPSLLLRSGNGANQFDYVQIGFGYGGGPQYRHHIRSRHNGGANSGNALDFFVWSPDARTPDGFASRHALTLDGGNVGIGVVSPSNAENLDRVVDLLGQSSAGVTVRTPSVEGRIIAHDQGIYNSFGPTMVVGTRSNHQLGLMTAGVARLTVTSVGNVGIGVNDPLNAEGLNRVLDVAGATSAGLMVRGQYVQGRVIAHDQGIFGSGGAAMVVGTSTGHALALATNGTTRVAVTTDGQVGIGTTTPENADGWSRVLDLLGGSNAKLSVRTSAIDARVMAHEGGFFGSAAGMVVGTKSSHAVSLATGGTTRMTVHPSGRVGIGSTDPQAWLDVTGVGDQPSQPPSLLLRSGNGSTGFAGVQIAFADKGSSNYRHTIRSRHNSVAGPGNAIDFILWDTNLRPGELGTTPTLTLNSGHVGVGTATPENGDNLHRVLDVLGADHAKLSVRTSDIDARVMAHENGFFGSNPGMIIGTKSSHQMSLATLGVTRMTVGKDGRIGIGSTDPQAWLDVTGAGDRTGAPSLLLRSGNGSSGFAGVQVAFADKGSSNYRHTIRTRHNGDWGPGNAIDFVLWDPSVAPGDLGSRPMLSLNSGKVGVCTTEPEKILTVHGEDNQVLVRRQNLSSGGGPKTFLEMRQDDANPPAVPEVRHGILFHHQNRFWQRIEAASDGFHLRWGPADDGHVDLTVQNLKVAGTIYWNGTRVNYSASDARLKTAVRPITSALRSVLALTGVRFRWDKAGLDYLTGTKEPAPVGPDATEQEHRRARDAEEARAALTGEEIGLLAQDVEPVVPELVHDAPDGYKHIRYGQLTALLVEAIKEQQETIERLAARVDALAAG